MNAIASVNGSTPLSHAAGSMFQGLAAGDMRRLTNPLLPPPDDMLFSRSHGHQTVGTQSQSLGTVGTQSHGLATVATNMTDAGPVAPPPDEASADDKELRRAFGNFVGQTFYGQMLTAMRKTMDKPAYFHGGRAEEVFQAQLDQVLAEKMSEATADHFVGPMFDLFTMNRR